MTRTIINIMTVSIMALIASSCCGSGEKAQATEGITSPAMETIMARRSIRAYKSVPVSRDTLDAVLRCGINAANAMNRQNWEIRVVDNARQIDDVTREAPVVIFVANATDSGMSQIDCGLLGGNIMIAATSLGLGTCCLGGPVAFLKTDDGRFFLDRLGFSEGYELLYAIAIGYPAESPDAKPRDTSKIRYVF